ncbi:MAG: DUF6763 family protein, partial [Stenotrophobium sp.]
REVSVGEWYQTDGEPFEIVGVDAKAEVVLVQHFDGTLEEFDFDSWGQLAARPTAPPEDYSGALDIGREDYDEADADFAVRSGRWENPLDLLDLR